jgi:rubrerythrin
MKTNVTPREIILGLEAADNARARVVDILEHLYRRETQQQSRYRQHGERIADPPVRQALLRMAAEEAGHVREITRKLIALGAKPPEIIEFRCAREPAWNYLRSDVDEEHRCLDELSADKSMLGTEYPDVVELLERLEATAHEHRAELRRLYEVELPMSLAA